MNWIGLGLDLGTTTCKGILMDDRGETLASTLLPYRLEADPDSPAAWESAARSVIEHLREIAPTWPPSSVGLCGRGGGLALLDSAHRPLTVPWAAVRRTADQLPIKGAGPHRKVAYWGRALRALGQLNPGVASQVATVLPVKDFVNFRLTGKIATDRGSAACPRWPRTAGRLGVPSTVLPRLRDMTDLLGTVSDAGATFGLPIGTPVAVGGHDGVCANVGAGALDVGHGCITLGTNAVVRLNTAGPTRLSSFPAAFTYPLVDSLWTSGADVTSGGAQIAWLVRLTSPDATGSGAFLTEHEKLSAAAGALAPGVGPIYVSGEASGQLQWAGSFLGLKAEHTIAHLARAVMEGVAARLRAILNRLEKQGHHAERLTLTGGGARSPAWRTIIASAIERRLALTGEETSARGAAILAAVAAGKWPSLREGAAALTSTTGWVDPDPAQTEACHSIAAALERWAPGLRHAARKGRG